MLSYTPNQEVIPLVTITRNRGRSIALAGNSVLHPQATQLNIQRLGLVLPKLVRWRLLAFYAPFYVGSDFEPSALESNAGRPHRNIRPAGKRINQILGQTASEYAAHKARFKAHAMLASLKIGAGHIDLVAMYKRYTAEKISHRNLSKFTGIKSAVFFPTLHALTKVSKQLDIPLGQIERALEMYTRYVELLQQQMLTTYYRPEPSLTKLSACHMAVNLQWRELAQIVYEDVKDIRTVSVFPKSERDLNGTRDENLKFRHAATRCCDLFFADIGTTHEDCDCAQGRHGRCLTRHDSRGLERSRDEDGIQNVLATSCLLSVFCLLVCCKLPHRWWDAHLARRCGCSGGKQPVYRLSRREEARLDGSLELMNEVLERGTRRVTPSTLATMWSWKNNPACRKKSTPPVFLPPIFEEEEDDDG